jgi:uncharacterized membrane protein YgcG
MEKRTVNKRQKNYLAGLVKSISKILNILAKNSFQKQARDKKVCHAAQLQARTVEYRILQYYTIAAPVFMCIYGDLMVIVWNDSIEISRVQKNLTKSIQFQLV